MRVDIKTIEGMVTALKAITNTGKEIALGPGEYKHKTISIPIHVFDQVKSAVNDFEKAQSN